MWKQAIAALGRRVEFPNVFRGARGLFRAPLTGPLYGASALKVKPD